MASISGSTVAVDSLAGGLGGAIGQKVLPAALKPLSNQIKGRIGEAVSLVNNVLQGNVPAGARGIGYQVPLNVAGRQPVLDWQFRNIFTGATTYVESKFGTSTLSIAQRAARDNLDNFVAEKWTYQFWGGAGAVGGSSIGEGLTNSFGGGINNSFGGSH